MTEPEDTDLPRAGLGVPPDNRVGEHRGQATQVARPSRDERDLSLSVGVWEAAHEAAGQLWGQAVNCYGHS